MLEKEDSISAVNDAIKFGTKSGTTYGTKNGTTRRNGILEFWNTDGTLGTRMEQILP